MRISKATLSHSTTHKSRKGICESTNKNITEVMWLTPFHNINPTWNLESDENKSSGASNEKKASNPHFCCSLHTAQCSNWNKSGAK